jgi:hypothetical protein
MWCAMVLRWRLELLGVGSRMSSIVGVYLGFSARRLLVFLSLFFFRGGWRLCFALGAVTLVDSMY